MESGCDRPIIGVAQRVSNNKRSVATEKLDRHELFDLRLFRRDMHRDGQPANRPRSSRRFCSLGWSVCSGEFSVRRRYIAASRRDSRIAAA